MYSKILISFFLLFPFLLIAQKPEVSFGGGIPELLSISARVLYPSFSGGLTFGFSPSPIETITTVTTDFTLPFGRMAKNVERKRSQLRFGMTYFREETSDAVFKKKLIIGRVGRNYYFSANVGIGIEGGIIYNFDEKTELKDPNTFDDSSFEFDVIPSIKIRLFVTID